MASLGKHKLRVSTEGDRDNYMEVEFPVTVNADGNFTTTLKEGDVRIIQSMHVNLRTNGRRNGREGFFEAKSLDGLTNQIRDILKECMSRHLVKEEIVLKYCITTAASFGYTKEGKIIPNTGYTKDGEVDQERGWQNGTEGTHAANPRPAGIRIYAKPYIVKTYRYQSGVEKQEDEEMRFRPNIPEEYGEAPNLHWLSNVVSTSPPRGGKMRTLPYTEERAEFFVKLYKSVFKMANMVAQFEEPEAMLALIDSGKLLMAPEG